MWSLWPFSKKKKSKYDDEQDSADIADSLFRIQAGYSVSEEAEKAQRDANYAKTYDRELNRLNKAGREEDPDNEEQNQEAARNAAEISTARLRTKKGLRQQRRQVKLQQKNTDHIQRNLQRSYRQTFAGGS